MNYKTKSLLSLLLIAVVAVALGFVGIVGIGPDKKFSAVGIKRGLDLAGGLSITYQTVKEDPTQEELSDTRYKLQLRVDNYSTEAAVYLEGSNRINVDIPGVSDAERILKELGQAGSIYFIYGTGNIAYDYETGNFVLAKALEEIQAEGGVVLDGSDIAKAAARQITAQNGVGYEYVVELNLNDAGRVKFAEATRNSIGKQIAIVYDKEVISAPSVSSAITDGNAIISGMAGFDEADRLATTIRIGALPLELMEIRSTVVGAQLGEEAISTSLLAAAVGFACVLLFMVVYYRIPGLAAGIALCIYIGLNIIVLNLFDVTLTLQGMAGIILSIGMAVDANVIIFQRIREELATGKTVRSSMKLGFGKALSAIVDGNVTTLIAAFVLYFLGSGGVKGFAITLAVGIILSMFTALTVTRFVLNALYGIGFDHEKFYGIQKERKVLPFVKNFKKMVAVSAVIIIAGFVAMGIYAAKGQESLNYGLDFKGGTSLSVTFPEELTEKLNQRLEKTVSEAVSLTGEIVKVTGENTYIIKTVELSQEQRAALTNALVEEYGVDETLIQTENISAKVSGEMRSDAVKAVIIATICMLLYIWIRFKNFNFAVGAVTPLLHDVLVVLAVYAVGRIAVGNTFIACMLTIVGYSINATIVVFDRIRENLMQQTEEEELEQIVDRSVTETLSRSINSSLTTFVMVLMLAVLGVDTIREFALPLMAGLIAGGWSSVCIAGSMWHLMETKIKRHAVERTVMEEE